MDINLVMFKSLFKSAKAAVAVATQEEIPAEVIHAEVDAVEESFLRQVKEIIASKSQETIAIDSRETRKADLLKDLGFGNSELIKDVSAKKQVNERLAKEAKLLEESVDLFNKYKSAYPLEKIMPFEEFEKVLKKYSLIYAPSQAYIKDVPEKNLLEIKNAKTLLDKHFAPDVAYLEQFNISLSYRASHELRISESKLQEEIHKFLMANRDLRFHNYTKRWTGEEDIYDFEIKQKILTELRKKTTLGNIAEDLYYSSLTKSKISRKGLFIAAPKSHFDLSILTQVSDYGYYANVKELKVVVTKDPIAFQILEGNEQYPEGFVRILSKWGTSDDQSYLDPEVQHGLMN